VSTGAAAVLPQGAADALVARYEDLRRWIIDGAGGGSRWGLVLLRREGLAAWITTWAAAPGAAVVDPCPEVARRLPDAPQVDVVRVLASMTTLLMLNLNGRSVP
jgi:hypothetical protein